MMHHRWAWGTAVVALSSLGACANPSDSAPATRESGGGAGFIASVGGALGAQGGASGVSSGIGGGGTAASALGGASNPGTSGSTGLGGLSGVGGSGAAGGGAGSNATAGSGGAGGAGVSTCPGIPILPDSGGLVAAASNSLGIHGSWFVYSDCPDQKGKPCATVTTPPANMFPNTAGKMCTSGMTSSATGAWGAGIALELNDGPPQQPYDTTAHGIKGFCMVFSGPTLPSTGVRVAFPTKNNPDNVYFEAVSTPGPHTVLFADTAQGSWVTTKTAFEPTQVMLLQLQIPSATTAPVPWDFCVEGLTAITN